MSQLKRLGMRFMTNVSAETPPLDFGAPAWELSPVGAPAWEPTPVGMTTDTGRRASVGTDTGGHDH